MATMKWHQPVKTEKGEYRYESRDGKYSVLVVTNGFALIFKNPKLNNGAGGDEPIGEYKTFMAANKEAVNHSQGKPTSKPKPTSKTMGSPSRHSPYQYSPHKPSAQQRRDDMHRYKTFVNAMRYNPFSKDQIEEFIRQSKEAYPQFYKDRE